MSQAVLTQPANIVLLAKITPINPIIPIRAKPIKTEKIIIKII